MSYIRRIIDSYLNTNWLIFVTFILIYSYYVKKQVIILSLINEREFNMWDIAFSIICDPFFIIYLILPIWIVISVNWIDNIWGESSLIRLSSYTNWLKYSLSNAILNLIVLQGFLIVLTFIVSLDFPLTYKWSEYSSVDLITNYSSYNLSTSNLNPVSALVIQILLLFLFLLVIHSILSLFFLFIRRTNVTYIFGLLIWVGIIISFKVFINNIWLNIANYISLPFLSSSFYSWLYPISVYIILMALIILIARIVK